MGGVPRPHDHGYDEHGGFSNLRLFLQHGAPPGVFDDMELDPEILEFVERIKSSLNDFARAVAGIAETLKPQIEAINAAFRNSWASKSGESFDHFLARMDKKERSRRKYYRMMARNRRR